MATDLPSDRCAALERSFSAWLARQPTEAPRGPVTISWLRTRSGEQPVKLLEERVPLDVVLGGFSSGFQRAAAAKLFRPGAEKSSPWLVIGQSELGWAARDVWADEPGVADLPHETTRGLPVSGRIGVNDPRRDDVTFLLVKSVLARGVWSKGYVDILNAFGRATFVGSCAGSAGAGLERGECTLAPVASDDPSAQRARRFVPANASLARGVALARNAPHPHMGEAFLRFVADTQGASVPSAAEQDASGADSLLADLLGAAVIDAHDELPQALAALDRAKRPDLIARWLTAPPWPPASVRKLYRKDPSGALAEELAAQITPAIDLQVWLIQSWEQPERPIDDRVLNDLAAAVNGKLLAEPRFRAWLRGEWGAWTRQNYRRIVRQLEGPNS